MEGKRGKDGKDGKNGKLWKFADLGGGQGTPYPYILTVISKTRDGVDAWEKREKREI